MIFLVAVAFTLVGERLPAWECHLRVFKIGCAAVKLRNKKTFREVC